MSRDAFICDAVRTPIGRYGGVFCGARDPEPPARARSRPRNGPIGVGAGAAPEVGFYSGAPHRGRAPRKREHGRAGWSG